MGQYLIRTLTDSTGHKFTHVTKARDNETFTVVKAESKEEAEEMAKWPKGLLEVVPSSFNDNPKNSCWQGVICMVYLIYRKGPDEFSLGL